MTTYYLSVGFDTTDTQSDGLHYDADYGFASSDGNAGATSLGNSGPQGRTFETVHLAAGGPGQPNQLVIALFTSIWNIDQTNSYFRVSFRPAHDVTPANNVALSPLSVGDTTRSTRKWSLTTSRPSTAGGGVLHCLRWWKTPR